MHKLLMTQNIYTQFEFNINLIIDTYRQYVKFYGDQRHPIIRIGDN